MKQSHEKEVILFLGKLIKKHIVTVRDLESYLGRKFSIALLTSHKEEIGEEIFPEINLLARTNLKRIDALENSLRSFRHRIVAIISRYENMMPVYSRLVSLFPYLKNPTPESLLIANDKLEMRKTLKKYAPKITPRFLLVKDVSRETIQKIEEYVHYPCIVKPANLSQSKLVTNCYDRAELEKTLKETFQKIMRLYRINRVEHPPKIVVEHLIEGDLYSVDVYVNSKGKFYFTPIIEIRTGKDIGYDDFFMYCQMTPSNLDGKEIEHAQSTVGKAIHAFGLRSCTAHVEFYRTKKGNYKIVEIGARPGGFREEILSDAYGIKHGMNDILIHFGKRPILHLQKKQHIAFLKFWPKKQGVLRSIKGIKRINDFPFVLRSNQARIQGERVGFSKFGHTYVCSFYVSGNTRAELQANIRKIEKTLEIIVE